jgi:hypothetical protein
MFLARSQDLSLRKICSVSVNALITTSMLASIATGIFLSTSQAAYADIQTEDPFMWMDTGAPMPTAQRPQTEPGKYQPQEPQKYQAPAPVAAPQGPMAHSNCYYPDGRPVTLDFPYGPMMDNHPGYAGAAYDERRGYMSGDDGILRGIQDNPCVEIYRRGGETPESAAGWLHPHDIRRVNTLEDRRIPIHTVGRYDASGENLWYSDPSQPFAEAAQEWDVREGELLSQLMRRWGAESGWTVVFQSTDDFIIEANVTIRGTFPEAAGEVMKSFSNSEPPLDADFKTGNRVIIIKNANDFDAR